MKNMQKHTIEQRLAAIEYRNKAVEADKAWEVSMLRRVIIALLILITIATYLLVIDSSNVWEGAVVASLGYFLSTLLIRSVKERWMMARKK